MLARSRKTAPDSRKLRRNSLLPTFERPSKTRPIQKTVKIDTRCVIKLNEKSAILASFSAILGQSRSVYLAEISAFAKLRPTSAIRAKTRNLYDPGKRLF